MVENSSLRGAGIHVSVLSCRSPWDKNCHTYFITTPQTCATKVCLHVQEPQLNCIEELILLQRHWDTWGKKWRIYTGC